MDHRQSNTAIRLNKFLAERLGVSRREADQLISSGHIIVDGQTAILGTKIDSKSNILYNGKRIPYAIKYTYLAFHKPVGYVCSRRAQGSTPTLYDLLPPKYRKLKTVGRLDKESSGLILLTDDGNFAFQMTHPKFRKTKLYEVELDRPLEPLHQQMISEYGIMLDDGPSQFKVIKNECGDLFSHEQASYPSSHTPSLRSRNSFEKSLTEASCYLVTLTEGRNRQIRRTFAALGYKVVKLHRISFGKYGLGPLKPGGYREFSV